MTSPELSFDHEYTYVPRWNRPLACPNCGNRSFRLHPDRAHGPFRQCHGPERSSCGNVWDAGPYGRNPDRTRAEEVRRPPLEPVILPDPDEPEP